MIDVVLPIAMGALIGYVTNWLAIKMLFWPREPKHIFGLRVPMTPGLFVRRRSEFSAAIADLAEDRFVSGEDIYAMVQRAEDQGVLDKFLDEMGPVFRGAYALYARKVTPEDFKGDCRRIAEAMRSSSAVSAAIVKKIDDMSSTEIETMVLTVVKREFQAITWLGAVLGGLIGVSQVFL